MQTADEGPPDKRLVDAFRKIPTPLISDALDELGIDGGCHGIKSVSSQERMAGPAITLRCTPTNERKKGPHVGHYIDDVQAGNVMVIDNSGRTHYATFGGLIVLAAINRGAAGTVIDGGARDVEDIMKYHYPLFSREYYMVAGKKRMVVESVNQEVQSSNIPVKSGDIVVGDQNGVLIIPKKRAEEVLEKAQAIVQEEQSIEKLVKGRMPLRDAVAQINKVQL